MLFYNPYLLWLLIFCLRKFFHCFFGSSTTSYLCFQWSELYFIKTSHKCWWYNPSSIFFHLTTILHYYLLLFLCHFFHIAYSTKRLIYSFISLYFLNTLFAETNSSWLIHESFKDLEIKTLIVSNLAFASNTIQFYASIAFFFL